MFSAFSDNSVYNTSTNILFTQQDRIVFSSYLSSMELLRPIANLCNLNKIMEKIISELVIADMSEKLDPSQFGNQKHISIQHYLVRLLNRILSNVDKNSKGEVNAVLCMFVDWKQAYSRQCHTLCGIFHQEWRKTLFNTNTHKLL